MTKILLFVLHTISKIKNFVFIREMRGWECFPTWREENYKPQKREHAAQFSQKEFKKALESLTF